MNEDALKTLAAMAEKMGTTADHLWQVLLHQAPISGFIDLCVMLAWLAASAALLRLAHKKQDGRDQDVVLALWAGAVCVTTFSAFIISCEASSVIAAFLNPEYWALMQILNR